MDATEILQSYLDEVSQTVLADDWETNRACIALPWHIVSHDESKVVSTEHDLEAGFDQFRDTLRFHRISDYIRYVETAATLDLDLISGCYVSHLISHGQRLLPPFRSQMTLRLIGNCWRAALVTNGLANSRWPLLRLQLHPDEKD